MMPMVLALVFMLTLASAPDAVLRGTVRDQSGLPVPRALVYVGGTQDSTETDSKGAFELRIDRPAPGVLVVFRDGFSAESVPFDPAALAPFSIVLTPAPVFETVTVTAPRAAAPPPSAFAMRPLDVVRTPGAAADLMRALQTLPGVSQIDEGAGLYVRGGDTSEVLVLLDDAVVFHPYRMETPGGGLFGSVPPFLLEGLSFSTGGFSAKYGNALSAVLDLHGLRRPEKRQATFTAGLAGASMSAALPLGPRGGLRVSGNRSFPGLLFAVNGRPFEFNPLPGGWDVNASAHYESPALGTFKLFANAIGDRVGIAIDSLAFHGLLQSSTSAGLGSLHWDKLIDKRWLTTATIGANRYVSTRQAGVLALDTTDLRTSWRVATERALGAWTLRAGADGVDARTQIGGSVPARGGDLGGTTGVSAFGVHYGDTTAGAYVEGERRWGPATTTTGMRVERFGLAREVAADPRVNVAVDTASHQRASLAWGIYHQDPAAAYYGYTNGARLDAMRARHLVFGYEYGAEKEPIHLRAETYWKTYDNLPLEATRGLFSSAGYGDAHGVDLFAHLTRSRVDVIADYSWLSAARRWTAFEDRSKYDLPASGTWRPDFDIPHTAHVQGRVDFPKGVSASLGWRISSGRLDTPVAGATATPSGYVPQYGSINSERLPRYERTDLSVTYLSRTSASHTIVLFASAGNVFGRRNFFEYAYNGDFSVRRPVMSATPRVFYFGMTFMR